MGGKSRKSGGVSRKLVERLKSKSGYSNNKKSRADDCGKVKPKTEHRGLFDETNE